MKKVKVYEIMTGEDGPKDYVAATSMKEASDFYTDQTGEIIHEIIELSEGSMEHLKHTGEEGMDDPMSFKLYLDKCLNGGDVAPFLFASEEY